MKRLTAILILASMLLISLCGCGGDVAESSVEESTVLSASTPPESIPGDESSADVPDKDEAFVILLRSGSFDIKDKSIDTSGSAGCEAGCYGKNALEFLYSIEHSYYPSTNVDIIEMSPIVNSSDISYIAYGANLSENSYWIDVDDKDLLFTIITAGKKSVAADKALTIDGKVVEKKLEVRDATRDRGFPATEGVHYENVGKPITMQGIRESISTIAPRPLRNYGLSRTVWSLRKEDVDVYISICNFAVFEGQCPPQEITFYVYFAIGDSIIKVSSPAFNLGKRKPVPPVLSSDGTYFSAGDDSDLAWPTLESFADYGGELIYGLVDTSTESCELIRRIKAAYANARTVPEE